ncbi:MurR/RpiR family transcriptional regulator [Vagococcus carniphilus]|uniref:MurR/RpiR family transcriptional regulator n=1 Tax=Vagococcus carniphilus TaxID=218144 RepID=A0AAW8UCX5_9ENTE|nr:MurR/RpiR family transcriptional regulator [Vagococcus carniphilus]MDT2830229.1 MurR/RpiR family transcriptional regulator [Vagococcus carniphilus]MDT2835082.1 MurR/RpiR family transcriptional regulator [Vagococcus carniphilus]MDT2838661.1 MurR/RpiR family transcriptional regulator [Vagococcus carniphilus]MDT2848264.1 MurR/RpiR family transcriptional regulator [Vagococcus carniphilus]MDT2853499.1 MurR/RpiR family transcriptional regulator [Vagococcus carniphilus]
MGLFTKLQQNQHLLNSQETKLLSYLMENNESLKNETLKDIANNLYVSPNTIVRMAKKLGFKGYTELKMSIEIENSQLKSLKKEKNLSLLNQIQQTEQLLTNETIDRICQKILDSNHVYFFSCGPSKYPCEEMKERLRVLGINTSLYFEPHVMNQRAKQLDEKDIVFIVSLSGETKTPLDAAKIAKLSSAYIVSITGFSQNSIAQLADSPLYTFYDSSTYAEMDISSRIGIHFILNHIFESLTSMCS